MNMYFGLSIIGIYMPLLCTIGCTENKRKVKFEQDSMCLRISMGIMALKKVIFVHFCLHNGQQGFFKVVIPILIHSHMKIYSKFGHI